MKLENKIWKDNLIKRKLNKFIYYYCYLEIYTSLANSKTSV